MILRHTQFKARFDKRIFVLYCALALSGHNIFNGTTLSVQPIYKKFQKKLNKEWGDFLPKFQKYFTRDHYVQYLLWTLRHSDFPEFKLTNKKKDSLQKDDNWFVGFDKLIRDFYQKAEIGGMFEEYVNITSRVIENEGKIVLRFLNEKLKPLHTEKVSFQKVYIVPNLLETKGAGFGVLLPSLAYVLFSPTFTQQDNILVLHEFLHCIINPIIDESKVMKRKFHVFKKIYPSITTDQSRKYYPQWEWVGYEYLVKLVLLVLLSPKERGVQMKKEKSWGFRRIEKMYSLFQRVYSSKNDLRGALSQFLSGCK